MSGKFAASTEQSSAASDETGGCASSLLRDEQTAAAPRKQLRLIVNADDFGASDEVNEAVIRAFREGVQIGRAHV